MKMNQQLKYNLKMIHKFITSTFRNVLAINLNIIQILKPTDDLPKF